MSITGYENGSINGNGKIAYNAPAGGEGGGGIVLFSSDGSSLTGFTNNNLSITNTVGNPSPSFQAVSGDNYAYYNLGSSFLNTTIIFDVNVGRICDFPFACNSSGSGQFIRLDARGAGNRSGFAATASWTSWSGPSTGSPVSPSVWYNIKIVISSSGVASWYLNNVLQSQTYTIANNGTYFGMQADKGGGTSYFDNIVITRNP